MAMEAIVRFERMGSCNNGIKERIINNALDERAVGMPREDSNASYNIHKKTSVRLPKLVLGLVAGQFSCNHAIKLLKGEYANQGRAVEVYVHQQ